MQLFATSCYVRESEIFQKIFSFLQGLEFKRLALRLCGSLLVRPATSFVLSYVADFGRIVMTFCYDLAVLEGKNSQIPLFTRVVARTGIEPVFQP